MTILVRVGIPAIAMAVAGGWWLMRRSLAPVEALTRAVERTHESNLRQQLPRSGNGDELDRLTGDVSGKGLPAALVMGVIHGAVRSSTWAGSAVDHERESRRLNELLCEKSSGARFASMFWGYYDSPTRQLCYVNAGHCPALLAGERDGRIEVTRLPATGTVLGLLPGATYQQAACDVRPGDVLVLYSDGVVEAATSEDEEYGESRLREALVAAGSAGPEGVRDGILASVGAFIGATALRDDLTLVVAKLA